MSRAVSKSSRASLHEHDSLDLLQGLIIATINNLVYLHRVFEPSEFHVVYYDLLNNECIFDHELYAEDLAASPNDTNYVCSHIMDESYPKMRKMLEWLVSCVP